MIDWQPEDIVECRPPSKHTLPGPQNVKLNEFVVAWDELDEKLESTKLTQRQVVH